MVFRGGELIHTQWPGAGLYCMEWTVMSCGATGNRGTDDEKESERAKSVKDEQEGLRFDFLTELTGFSSSVEGRKLQELQEQLSLCCMHQ